MPKPELEFHDTAKVLTAQVNGEEHTVLAKDPATGDTTMILFFPPGYAQDSQPRVHDFWEEVYILEGRIYDRSLDQWFGPGYYACRPPGMIHGPYDADPKVGVRQFVNVRFEHASSSPPA